LLFNGSMLLEARMTSSGAIFSTSSAMSPNCGTRSGSKLLVVSTDCAADNQAIGLRSPVVLENPGMGVGRQFGANGTPMAVLIDAEGKIAFELAAGAPAVLQLAGQEQAQPNTIRVGPSLSSISHRFLPVLLHAVIERFVSETQCALR
jgi:hypothetical protein